MPILRMATIVAMAVLLTASTAIAADLSAMTWDEIATRAKAEGELTWSVGYLQNDLRRFVGTFEHRYGIKVRIPEGSTQANADKLVAEKGRRTDVFSWGFDDYETIDKTSFFIPLTMLPQDSGRVTKLLGVDNGGYVLAYWGNQTGIAYDPAKLTKDALPQTPEQFAAFWQAHPGKFGFNYQYGGAGPSFVQNMMRIIDKLDFDDGTSTKERLTSLQPSFDFFNRYAKDYVVTTGNGDSITRISDGEFWMAPAWEDQLAGLQRRGEVRKDIAFYIPKMGMSGGANGVAIPLNAPHPDAAALFVYWLTSAETQSALNRDFGTMPMNTSADDSHALVPKEQRQYETGWAAQPFRNDSFQAFIDNVVLKH